VRRVEAVHITNCLQDEILPCGGLLQETNGGGATLTSYVLGEGVPLSYPGNGLSCRTWSMELNSPSRRRGFPLFNFNQFKGRVKINSPIDY